MNVTVCQKQPNYYFIFEKCNGNCKIVIVKYKIDFIIMHKNFNIKIK